MYHKMRWLWYRLGCRSSLVKNQNKIDRKMKDLRKFYYWCAFITILLFSLLQWYFHLNPTTIEEDNKLLLSKIREREIKAVIKKKKYQ